MPPTVPLLPLQAAAPQRRKHRGVLLAARPRPETGLARLGRYPPDQEKALQAAESIGRTCGFEADHTFHVTRLALELFDGLRKLHHLGTTERFYLACAGILHDIGWVEGWKGHHKASLRIILRTPLLPLDHRERLVVGSVARYHARAMPGTHHDHFAALSPSDQRLVLVLAACLRLADGFDRTHRGQVLSVSCRATKRKIRIRYQAASRQRKNEKAASKNSDLLKKVFDRDVLIRWDSGRKD